MGRVILIAGPTASGKTRASLILAQTLNAEIINADAMQVYRDIPILSAQPSQTEKTAAPHRLFGEVDGAQRYSAGQWARAAKSAIEAAHNAGRDAIVVGGTGLYFRALLGGLVAIPEIPADARAEAQRVLEEDGPGALRAALLALDPAMERLAPNDLQRHVRAYEVALGTGRPLSSYQAEDHDGAAADWAASVAKIVIEPERQGLYAQCDARFDQMMDAGALEEAAALHARELDPGLPVMKALGAPSLMGYLRGETSLDEAITLAKTRTRQFAKRQMTWFRNQTSDWRRVANSDDAPPEILRQR